MSWNWTLSAISLASPATSRVVPSAPSTARRTSVTCSTSAAHTRDLSASLRSSGRCLGVGSVLNLCESGMLVELSSDLEVGEIGGFELVGPRFRCVGFAAVAPGRTRGSACGSTPGRVPWTARSVSWSPRECVEGSWDHTILARRPTDSRRCGILGREASAIRSTLPPVTPTRAPGPTRG